MEFDLAQEFPVGLDRLWRALGRVDYVEQKYRSLDSIEPRVLQFSADARRIKVELEREARVDREQLPLWARAFTGTRQTVHHRTVWRRVGRRRVEVRFDIAVPGKPVSARGTGSVVELSRRYSRMSLHFDAVSTSPVLKSSVAEEFVRQVRRALDADYAFTLEYLRASRR